MKESTHIGYQNYIGFYVRDKITGFNGLCTGYAKYYSGEESLLIAPMVDKECKYIEPLWFSVQRVGPVLEQTEMEGI